MEIKEKNDVAYFCYSALKQLFDRTENLSGVFLEIENTILKKEFNVSLDTFLLENSIENYKKFTQLFTALSFLNHTVKMYLAQYQKIAKNKYDLSIHLSSYKEMLKKFEVYKEIDKMDSAKKVIERDMFEFDYFLKDIERTEDYIDSNKEILKIMEGWGITFDFDKINKDIEEAKKLHLKLKNRIEEGK